MGRTLVPGRARWTKTRSLRPTPVTRASGSASPPGSSARAADGFRSRSNAVCRAVNAAIKSVWRTALGAFRRRLSVGARWFDDGSDRHGHRAACDRGRHGSGSSAPPIKEIDVDLSPGGLENVSMTMRLAGDKLSVVIRAASSHSRVQSKGRGMRLRIAWRRSVSRSTRLSSSKRASTPMGTNGSSADSGAGRRTKVGARRRGARGSDDAGLSRRGAGRDRSF